MTNEIRNSYEFGKFRFNAQTNSLWRDGELIPLPPKALELLKLLVEKRGEVASKQEILDTVWANTFVEEGVLTQNIYTLRQVLGSTENGRQLIENLPRRGYRLTIPVEPLVEGQKEIKTENRADDDGSVNKLARGPAKRSAFGLVLGVLAVVSLSVIGVFSYRFFTAKVGGKPNSVTGNLRLKQLTDTGDVSYLTISPDGNTVAFTRGFDIYWRNLQNNQENKLKVENAPKVGCLQFSADGREIYFGTVFNRDEKGSVFRLPLAPGGTPVDIAEDVWSGFSLSPDGTELAFVRKFPAQSKQGLVIKNIATGTEQILKTVNLPEEFYWNNYPAWSADGKYLALVTVTQTEHFSRLIVLERENGRESELKPENFRNIEQVVWGADSDTLIIAANDGSNFQLWKVSTSGERPVRITNDLDSYLGISISQDRKKLISRQRIYFSNIWIGKKDELPNLRPLTEGTSRNDGLQGLVWFDEEKIIYTSNDEKIRDWNLWRLDTANGSKQKLTSDTETQNDFPAVSPDKKHIYFASDRNRESRIWRIDSDGRNPVQITFGEDETHHFPQISPDGNWLYFIIKSGRSSTVGRKSLQDNSVQELSGKTRFVPGNFLLLSPDGKYLAFQNIIYRSQTDHQTPKLQLALLSTENPDQVSFREIEAWRQAIQWSAEPQLFDFVVGNVKENGIIRHSLTEKVRPVEILPATQSTIFNFAWSPSGAQLAVSRGELRRDVVLLTNFE
jgi:DNA-binding winged helix-turn-helix (wHTH) protein/Tol biopolymer transport system component